MFNERQSEYSAKQGKEIPVWKTPKYEESKKKAEELIKSVKYGLSESDFWILMNETKSGKMAYNGLIISHNGCLKINDGLESKFDPACVTINENGYAASLVFYYCNSAQGLFEVGEVSAKNCKNDYPYAMALKRLFDRVVLKLSKLAYSGIYGEDEADEFRSPQSDTKKQTIEDIKDKWDASKTIPKCEKCQKIIVDRKYSGVLYTADQLIEMSKAKYDGHVICPDCAKEMNDAESNG